MFRPHPTFFKTRILIPGFATLLRALLGHLVQKCLTFFALNFLQTDIFQNTNPNTRIRNPGQYEFLNLLLSTFQNACNRIRGGDLDGCFCTSLCSVCILLWLPLRPVPPRPSSVRLCLSPSLSFGHSSDLLFTRS